MNQISESFVKTSLVLLATGSKSEKSVKPTPEIAEREIGCGPYKWVIWGKETNLSPYNYSQTPAIISEQSQSRELHYWPQLRKRLCCRFGILRWTLVMGVSPLKNHWLSVVRFALFLNGGGRERCLPNIHVNPPYRTQFPKKFLNVTVWVVGQYRLWVSFFSPMATIDTPMLLISKKEKSGQNWGNCN